MTSSITARLSALAAVALVAGCGSSAEPRSAASAPVAPPRFSVDAARLRGLAPIAFVGATASGTDLFVLEADGQARNLTNDAAVEGAPAFSPDGRWIAYGSRGDGGDSDLMVIAARGGKPRRLTHVPTEEGTPTWSPDGKQIAFGLETADETRFAIYVIGTDGGKARKLVERLGGCTDENPDWSPDGRRIAYMTGCSEQDSAIMVMDADGSDPREVARLLDVNVPEWSPDGRRLAYKSDRGRAIYASRPDGSGLRRLTPDLGTESVVLDWSRDGERIVYIDGYGSEIGVFDASGGKPRRLTRGLMASGGVSVAP